jgi:hypothetical protein
MAECPSHTRTMALGWRSVSRSRVPIVLAIFGSALLLAGSALGAFQSGKYKGTTEQNLPIVFKATQGQVKKLRVNTIALCDSGYGSKGKFLNVHGPITNSRFNIVAKFDHGATTLIVKGRLTRTFAGGTIVDRTRVDPEKEGEPDPQGTDHCKSTFHWAAEIGG